MTARSSASKQLTTVDHGTCLSLLTFLTSSPHKQSSSFPGSSAAHLAFCHPWRPRPQIPRAKYISLSFTSPQIQPSLGLHQELQRPQDRCIEPKETRVDVFDSPVTCARDALLLGAYQWHLKREGLSYGIGNRRAPFRSPGAPKSIQVQSFGRAFGVCSFSGRCLA